MVTIVKYLKCNISFPIYICEPILEFLTLIGQFKYSDPINFLVVTTIPFHDISTTDGKVRRKMLHRKKLIIWKLSLRMIILRDNIMRKTLIFHFTSQIFDQTVHVWVLCYRCLSSTYTHRPMER